MIDKRRERLIEEYEEAAIRLLMDEYAEIEGEALWQEFEKAVADGEVPDVPKDLDEKCRKLIDSSFSKQRRKHTLIRTTTAIARFAACFCIILGLTTVTVLSVDAFRIPVLNFFMEISSKYSSVSFDESDTTTDIHNHILERVSGAPISEGYQLAAQNMYDDGTISFLYQNENGYLITLEVRPSQGKLYYDTEDATQTDKELCGHSAIFIEKDGFRIIWTNETQDVTFDLFSNGLEENAFWKLAYYLAE